jgi:plastocyanin
LWAVTALAWLLTGGSGAPGEAVADGTGTIEGEVLYEGAVPPPTIVMEGGRTQHLLYLGPKGELRFAVAYLRTADHGPGGEMEPVTLNQSGFIFEPQVLAIRDGQPVRFGNEDGANHNVRSDSQDVRNRFSLYTGAGQSQTRRLRAESNHRPMAITCDIHPWMIAWIYTFTHPYFAVTDATGRFRIVGVPAGPQQLLVRHPAGGLRRGLSVQIMKGQVASVKIRFASAELHSAAPAE